MSWFRNQYLCEACNGHWIAEHTEAIEAHCPHCRAYDVVPYRSDDLTIIVATPAVTDRELVVALKATAAKMRVVAPRPRSRRPARAVAH
jgi:hypothetical protein